jgi:elongation factor G
MSANKIRNLCLISHGGAGKTTLTEMTLNNAGVFSNPGTIEKGNTHSDFMPEEKARQFSINNSYFTIPWTEYNINLIDTPGYADFRGEVASSFRMVEGAVLLIDATSGIEVNTSYVWKMAEDNQLPRFIFINKMDKEGANFDKVYEDIKNTFNGSFMPLTIPFGNGDGYQGVVDLLTKKYLPFEEEKEQEIPEGIMNTVEEMRMELVESVVELDEKLMEKYFADEEITDQELIDGLIEGVAAGEIIPVFAGSALKNSGLNKLFDYLVKLVPAPEARESIKGSRQGEEIDVKIVSDGPVVGLVCKTMVDPYIGKLSIFRVLTGHLTKDSEIYIPRIDNTVKISKLYKLNGAEQNTVDELSVGDIGAVAKMDELETSDTISSGIKIELEPIDLPQPMLTLAALPASEGDDEKMSTSLNRVSQEDRTFKVEYNKETKELLITAMGTVHIDVIKNICKRKFDVDFVTSIPKIAYKETIQTKVEIEEKYKKQSGGRGQYGHVFLRLEPLARGKGFEFHEEIFGGAIPNQYIPAVEKGIVEAKDEGVIAGYPVVDFKATVYDGSYHPVDSSEMAFKIAASKGFKKGMEQAKPVLLEPIMNISVTVPESYMGDIMGDLNSRRGKILGIEPDDGNQIIKAQVPQAELFTYATDLKSIAGGHGNFTMTLSHYDKVPARIEEEVVNERKKESN